MSNDSWNEYIALLKPRYQTANREDKRIILDELCKTREIHRKSAIRMLGRVPKKKESGGRPKGFSPICLKHLVRLWHKLDYMCSKKMVAALPDWLGFYDEPGCTQEVKKELQSMSAATIDRYLKPYRAQMRRRRNTGTKSVKLLRHIIPIKPLDFHVESPGYIEADTVAHCGGSLAGEFIWTLTFTDVFSGWTENRAIWNKRSEYVHGAVLEIEKGLPFEIKVFASDNGSEFLTHVLLNEFQNNPKRGGKLIEFQRGRPYKKNDQCYVGTPGKAWSSHLVEFQAEQSLTSSSESSFASVSVMLRMKCKQKECRPKRK